MWLDFDPQMGREIQKTRPAIIISPTEYNAKTRLALVVPITSKIKGLPFEIFIKVSNIEGVILCDQVRSLDWRARNIRPIAKVSDMIVLHILEKLTLLLE